MSDKRTFGRVKISKPLKSHRTGEQMFTIEGAACVTDWEDWGFTEEAARRIVACWNACEGLTTEALEKLGTLDRARVARDVERDRAIKQGGNA